jgi:LPS-assembly lipoprotein
MHPYPGRSVLLAATLLLGACGFHLAGRESLPPALAKPYLSFHDSYTDFAREFQRQLETSGAVVQSDAGTATVTVDVSKDEVQQRVLSVSAANIPTEYELTYTVTFAARDAVKQLLAPQTLSLARDYSFVETALLAKEHEEDILRVQMARDLAVIVTRRLASLK